MDRFLQFQRNCSTCRPFLRPAPLSDTLNRMPTLQRGIVGSCIALIVLVSCIGWYRSRSPSTNHSLSLATASFPPSPEDLVSCSFDRDCALVSWDPSCPGTAVAVNQSAQHLVENNRTFFGLPPRVDPPHTLCGAADVMPVGAICKRGRCETRCNDVWWNWQGWDCRVKNWPPAQWSQRP